MKVGRSGRGAMRIAARAPRPTLKEISRSSRSRPRSCFVCWWPRPAIGRSSCPRWIRPRGREAPGSSGRARQCSARRTVSPTDSSQSRSAASFRITGAFNTSGGSKASSCAGLRRRGMVQGVLPAAKKGRVEHHVHSGRAAGSHAAKATRLPLNQPSRTRIS
jgi:hypothetical protein